MKKKTNAHGKCLIHYDNNNNYYHLLTSPSLPCLPLGTPAFNGHASVCHESLRWEVDGIPRANDNEQLICVTDFLFHQPFLNMLLVFPNSSHFHYSNLHSCDLVQIKKRIIKKSWIHLGCKSLHLFHFNFPIQQIKNCSTSSSNDLLKALAPVDKGPTLSIYRSTRPKHTNGEY